MADEGFLGRWSRRKLDVQQGRAVEAEPMPAPVAPASDVVPAQAGPHPAGDLVPQPPAPTLEDVAALTPESDFSRFVTADVVPEVKNAAVKKLFADPHFNLMDGLDVYIDDYSQPDPIPERMLRDLASAEFLGLFREVPSGEPGPRDAADAGAAQSVAQCPAPASHDEAAPGEADPERASQDADPDLRLQQDHAAGPPGSGPGPG